MCNSKTAGNACAPKYQLPNYVNIAVKIRLVTVCSVFDCTVVESTELGATSSVLWWPPDSDCR